MREGRIYMLGSRGRFAESGSFGRGARALKAVLRAITKVDEFNFRLLLPTKSLAQLYGPNLLLQRAQLV